MSAKAMSLFAVLVCVGMSGCSGHRSAPSDSAGELGDPPSDASPTASPDTSPVTLAALSPVQEHLNQGRLQDAEAALLAKLDSSPGDDDARYALGCVQLLRAVENLMQARHLHGLHDASGLRMIFRYPRLPFTPNENPQPIGYERLREIGRQWLAGLARAERTLAQIRSDDATFRVAFGLIRLDMDGDGVATEAEAFWDVYRHLNRRAPATAAAAANFVICFDRADVEWLRGYCHLLSALGESLLAYDHQEWFERAGRVLFPRIETPHDYLNQNVGGAKWGGSDWRDLIAAIHLANFPLREPERMRAALGHLEQTLAHSRRMWELALLEQDDHHEWIPNPQQTGVIPGVRVTDDMITAWREFIAEAEALLAGTKLIPFWRCNDGRGINLRRVFTEPQKFDVVLWCQGTAATPYLEHGELTSQETWQQLLRVFEGEFISFALWFN